MGEKTQKVLPLYACKTFHSQKHKKVRPYKCDACGKRFPRPKNSSKSEFLPFSIHSSSERFDWISGLSGSFLRFLRAGMMARESRTEGEPGWGSSSTTWPWKWEVKPFFLFKKKFNSALFTFFGAAEFRAIFAVRVNATSYLFSATHEPKSISCNFRPTIDILYTKMSVWTSWTQWTYF